MAARIGVDAADPRPLIADTRHADTGDDNTLTDSRTNPHSHFPLETG
jgi:hypothetical protein